MEASRAVEDDLCWVGDQDTQAQTLMPVTSQGSRLITPVTPCFWFIALVRIGHSPGATSVLITGESEMQSAPAMAQPQGAKVKNRGSLQSRLQYA